MNTRRQILLGMTGFAMTSKFGFAAASKHQARFVVRARGLQAPEGPKVLPNGDVLVCEMARGALSRVSIDGAVRVFAQLGGSPNGQAIGPDGASYVVNSGGMSFRRDGDRLIPDPPAASRSGGKLQRVDLKSGQVIELYSQSQGHPLRAPNDIVFDRYGDCWFTDPGVAHSNGAERGVVFCAAADGTLVRRMWEVPGPNGIAFSPDGLTLYVALTGKRSVVSCPVVGRGQLAMNVDRSPKGRTVAILQDPHSYLDSMAVEADGTLVVGTLFAGCLSLIEPDGRIRDQLFFPEQFVTNLAFGGRNLRTAFVTLTSSGILAEVAWPRPGLRLAFQ